MRPIDSQREVPARQCEAVEKNVERPTVRRSTRFDDLPDLLTPEEFGAYLGLSRNTTYDLLARTEVPHRRFGRAIRIPKSAVHIEGIVRDRCKAA